jgi:hypothetical protein
VAGDAPLLHIEPVLDEGDNFGMVQKQPFQGNNEEP